MSVEQLWDLENTRSRKKRPRSGITRHVWRRKKIRGRNEKSLSRHCYRHGVTTAARCVLLFRPVMYLSHHSFSFLVPYFSFLLFLGTSIEVALFSLKLVAQRLSFFPLLLGINSRLLYRSRWPWSVKESTEAK